MISLKLSSKATEQCRTVSKSLIENKRLILTSMHHLNNLRHMQTDLRITSLLLLYLHSYYVTTCFRYFE